MIAWMQISIRTFKYRYKLIHIHFLLYNSSIADIEHSPNYTAFGLPQTHQVRQ